MDVFNDVRWRKLRSNRCTANRAEDAKYLRGGANHCR